MSTRKIEGWVNEGYGHNTNIAFITEKFPKVNRPMEATLIIGGKGYTEEEVKAMLKDVITAQSDPSQFVTRQHGSFLGDWIKAAVSKALATHGITIP